ncbi:mtDNA inheritance, partitioning of the mitochondrial organelle [Gonapodya sp. JEL0774]|nr:mtDNA inheritance, partitioning of the mitochondrial organelle [Gonapodya sp. JEL0774]
MREIVTLQFGNHSSHVLAHLWNICDRASSLFYLSPGISNLSRDKIAPFLRHLPSDLEWDSDVLFRVGYDVATGVETYTPRAVVFDTREGFGGLSKSGGLYGGARKGHEENEGLGATWGGQLQVFQQEPWVQSEYLKHLDEESSDAWDGSGFADRSSDSATPITTQRAPNFNLSATVSTWSDFCRVYFHPRSAAVIPPSSISPAAEDPMSPFPTFTSGMDCMANESEFVDGVMEDQIRLFVEECDAMQGFLAVTGVDDGWGGFAAGILDRIRDDYGDKCVVVTVGIAGEGSGVNEGHYDEEVDNEYEDDDDTATPGPRSRINKRAKRGREAAVGTSRNQRQQEDVLGTRSAGTSLSQIRSLANNALSLHHLSSTSSLYLPMHSPTSANLISGGGWNRFLDSKSLDLSKIYTTSALVATALDTLLLPSRLRDPTLVCHLDEMSLSMRIRPDCKVAGVAGALPFPVYVNERTDYSSALDAVPKTLPTLLERAMGECFGPFDVSMDDRGAVGPSVTQQRSLLWDFTLSRNPYVPTRLQSTLASMSRPVPGPPIFRPYSQHLTLRGLPASCLLPTYSRSSFADHVRAWTSPHDPARTRPFLPPSPLILPDSYPPLFSKDLLLDGTVLDVSTSGGVGGARPESIPSLSSVYVASTMTPYFAAALRSTGVLAGGSREQSSVLIEEFRGTGGASSQGGRDVGVGREEVVEIREALQGMVETYMEL